MSYIHRVQIKKIQRLHGLEGVSLKYLLTILVILRIEDSPAVFLLMRNSEDTNQDMSLNSLSSLYRLKTDWKQIRISYSSQN